MSMTPQRPICSFVVLLDYNDMLCRTLDVKICDVIAVVHAICNTVCDEKSLVFTEPSHRITSQHITSHRITSHRITSHHITSHLSTYHLN
jgi:hypothetical protein